MTPEVMKLLAVGIIGSLGVGTGAGDWTYWLRSSDGISP